MGGSQLYLSEEVEIPAENEFLSGHLEFPSVMDGFVVFAHGSGSNRFSPRNHIVAQILHKAGIGTLLFNLLSAEEANDRRNVFNIPFLANRLLSVMRWVEEQNIMESFPVGLFGASTGASAALWAAAELGNKITAVVSRGGRPDLALTRLREVTAPTLLIVGGYDEPVVEMNEAALHYLSHGKLIVVPGATHLFEEPGTLQQVANHAANWFQVHFRNISHVKAA
jgi:putative phosphoribosyl transferase